MQAAFRRKRAKRDMSPARPCHTVRPCTTLLCADATAAGTPDATPEVMGMLLVLAVIIAFVGVGYLFVHALTTPEGESQHGWLAVLPLVVIFGWVVEQLVTH